MARSEQEIFDDLAALCRSPGYIHVLGYLALRDNYVTYDGTMTSEAMANSYAPVRTVRTEFSTLFGLLMRAPIDFGLPSPSEMQRLISRTESLLAELHTCLGRPMVEAITALAMASQTGSLENVEHPFRRADVLREPIFYGAESAYSFQYREMALDRYALDEEWLLANKGFRLSDANLVAAGLSRLQTRKIGEALDTLPKLNPRQWTILPGFTFTLSEIAAETRLDSSTAAAVLLALSVSAPTNAGFTSLGDFNLANACPILRTPTGDYVSLEPYGVFESLYDSPFYWMAADKAYRDVAFTNRGAFTERFVEARLSAVFNSDNVHGNVKIFRGNVLVSEIDVLVLFGDRAIVVQCKAKRLTLEARKGNDNQLRADFRKSVQEAYDQGLVCSRSLKDPGLRFVAKDGTVIKVPTLREIYVLCAVSDHYPALAVQAQEFLIYEQDEFIQAPLVTDVFLIDVLAEMLSSPLQFLSYLNRRVNYAERINSANETAILGYHLSQNLWLDDNMDMVMVAEEYSISLDTAMTVRREKIVGNGTPEGILTRSKGTLVEKILKVIEHQQQPALIDLGFMLLTLSGSALDDLDHGLGEISAKTRSDGQPHDFTMVFDTLDSGLTVHCNRWPNAVAANMLAEHCGRRKYAQKAASWFGLVVRADDGLPKFGFHLRFPWEHDPELDEVTKEMAKAPAKS